MSFPYLYNWMRRQKEAALVRRNKRRPIMYILNPDGSTQIVIWVNQQIALHEWQNQQDQCLSGGIRPIWLLKEATYPPESEVRSSLLLKNGWVYLYDPHTRWLSIDSGTAKKEGPLSQAYVDRSTIKFYL